MKSYRRYTFPPLSRLLPGAHDAAESASPDAALTEEVLEEYRKAGYDEGHAAGYADGRRREGESAKREARAALDAISEPLDVLVTGFGQLQNEYRAAARDLRPSRHAATPGAPHASCPRRHWVGS